MKSQNSSHPEFSVIIPTLQEERVLPRTLAQFTPALKQRYSLEIIVSDGGSKDETLSMAHIGTYIVIEAVEGVRQTIAMGRNAGAAASHGSILVFIDADVLIDDIEQFFETLHSIISDPKTVGITCNVQVYQAEERFSDKFFHQFYNRYFYFLNMIGIGMGRGECQVIRKSTFIEAGGFNEAMAAGEDFEMFTRLKKLGHVIFAHALTVRESPRRFRKFGYLYMSGLWFMNALSVWLFHKPVVSQWKVVR